MLDKKIELKNLKGTMDFLPNQQLVRNQIIDKLRKNFVKYGYMPLETTILNEFDLLKYKYEDGAEILSEIYKLSDQGKRDLGLRYDLTIPFCKVIGLNKDLTMPFRRYEIGKVFRDGPVKAGRAREFYQCDVDVVGIDGRYIEAEQMQMVVSIFNDLGIDIDIKWNNRKLMCGVLEFLHIDNNKFDEVIGLIDRLEKISMAELYSCFNEIQIEKEKVDEILQLFSLSLEDYKKLSQDTEIANLKEGVEECVELQKLIDALNLNNNAIFSPKLARGLGIYTNTVFEFFDKKKRITSSLGGGGRYNKIITNFMDNGINYPAVGLTFGLEPIYYILSEEISCSFVDVLVVPMGTEIECLKVANKLRDIGAKVIIDFSGKKVKKAFEYANKLSIKYVMVIGENEINSNLFSIKDMEKGEQITVSIDEVIALVKNSL